MDSYLAFQTSDSPQFQASSAGLGRDTITPGTQYTGTPSPNDNYYGNECPIEQISSNIAFLLPKPSRMATPVGFPSKRSSTESLSTNSTASSGPLSRRKSIEEIHDNIEGLNLVPKNNKLGAQDYQSDADDVIESQHSIDLAKAKQINQRFSGVDKHDYIVLPNPSTPNAWPLRTRHLLICTPPADCTVENILRTLQQFGELRGFYSGLLNQRGWLFAAYFDTRAAATAHDVIGPSWGTYLCKFGRLTDLNSDQACYREHLDTKVSVSVQGKFDDHGHIKRLMESYGNLESFRIVTITPHLKIHVEYCDVRNTSDAIVGLNDHTLGDEVKARLVVKKPKHESSGWTDSGLMMKYTDVYMRNQAKYAATHPAAQLHVLDFHCSSKGRLRHGQEKERFHVPYGPPTSFAPMQADTLASLSASISTATSMRAIIGPNNTATQKVEFVPPSGWAAVQDHGSLTYKEKIGLATVLDLSKVPANYSSHIYEGIQTSHPIKPECLINLHKIMDGTDRRTTLMLRNMPNKLNFYHLKEWMDVVNENEYDFMYLRMDFQNEANVGYAFVNFMDPMSIVTFCRARIAHKWTGFNSLKCVEFAYATIQGKYALIEKFRNSSIMESPPDYRPRIFYSSGNMRGCPEPFPPPNDINRKLKSMNNAQQFGLFKGGSITGPHLALVAPEKRICASRAGHSEGYTPQQFNLPNNQITNSENQDRPRGPAEDANTWPNRTSPLTENQRGYLNYSPFTRLMQPGRSTPMGSNLVERMAYATTAGHAKAKRLRQQQQQQRNAARAAQNVQDAVAPHLSLPTANAPHIMHMAVTNTINVLNTNFGHNNIPNVFQQQQTAHIGIARTPAAQNKTNVRRPSDDVRLNTAPGPRTMKRAQTVQNAERALNNVENAMKSSSRTHFRAPGNFSEMVRQTFTGPRNQMKRSATPLDGSSTGSLRLAVQNWQKVKEFVPTGTFESRNDAVDYDTPVDLLPALVAPARNGGGSTTGQQSFTIPPAQRGITSPVTTAAQYGMMSAIMHPVQRGLISSPQFGLMSPPTYWHPDNDLDEFFPGEYKSPIPLPTTAPFEWTDEPMADALDISASKDVEMLPPGGKPIVYHAPQHK